MANGQPTGPNEGPRIAEGLLAGALDALPAGRLAEQLREERPLRVKLGVDPTSPDIHLGHCVVLTKLRAFQDAGHTVVLIIGDYTAMVGDPSGRDATRPVLSADQVEANGLTYQEQAFTVLDRERTEVRHNSEWLRMESDALFDLVRRFTVARLLERDDFSRRIAAAKPISVLELLYPVLQGYDSVAVEADIELGGTDQLYNLLAGREVMQAYGLEPQLVLTTPLLVSWDGEKMSSSVGNNIPLAAAPEEQFGRTMRISDDLLGEWYRLVLEQDLPDGADPLEAKLALARWIVTRSHGEEAAREAEAHFTRVVREGRAPDDVPEVDLPTGDPVHLPAALAEWFGVSTSEARRWIAQGGVRVDGDVEGSLDIDRGALAGKLVQAGKRRFVRVRS